MEKINVYIEFSKYYGMYEVRNDGDGDLIAAFYEKDDAITFCNACERIESIVE